MPHTCFVHGCTNRSDDKTSFYAIPGIINRQGEQTFQLSTKRREAWIAAINRKKAVTKYSKVCSDHFVTGKPSALYDTAHPDWIPTQLMSSEEREKKESSENGKCEGLDRYNRAKGRQQKKDQHNAAEALLGLSRSFEPEINTECDTNSSSSVNCTFSVFGPLRRSVSSEETIAQLKDKYEAERLRCNKLQEENEQLRTKLASYEFRPEAFEGNDKMVRYLTGLSTFSILMSVFSLVCDQISETSMSSLTKFQKFILVCMRLRLNMPVQDLAYRFGVSASTVSRIFLSVVHVMYIRMQPFIVWPDRQELYKTMPMEFRKSFGRKVASIIDCFEIFIERPSNLKARAQTWSQYKHKNTVKFLISITPQGSVSFISNGWGGRASDKYITEHSGFLDKLTPGDVILADRGFDIKESVGLMCAEVKIPAFTRGKKQLSALEVENTRKIAHVRIHVERVIGLVRNKYTILQSTLPIDFLMCDENNVPVIDKLVTVCSAMTNFCASVIPFN